MKLFKLTYLFILLFILYDQSNCKGKYLTRSHAISESTSPPCTPSPEGDLNFSKKNNTQSLSSSSSPSAYLEVPLQRNWQDKQTIIMNGGEANENQNDLHSEYELGHVHAKPLLPINVSDGISCKDVNDNTIIALPLNTIEHHEADTHSNDYPECIEGPVIANIEDDLDDGVNGIGGRKGRHTVHTKNAKPRGKGNVHHISHENIDNIDNAEFKDGSIEYYTDQSGVDLLQFFKNTLNKNSKDRHMLLRIERELSALAQDEKYVIS